MYRIDFNKLRFLICDDNPHMRRILRTLLHSFGAREVYESEDGATALEMYTHYVPDIVITDWSMPIFDGLELSQMIRQPESKGNPYAPIIMLTGHSEKFGHAGIARHRDPPLLGMAGQHDDRCVGIALGFRLPDHLGEFETVENRHRPVGDDDVRNIVAVHFQRGGAVLGFIDLAGAERMQQRPQYAAHMRIVVAHQKSQLVEIDAEHGPALNG